MRRCRSLVYLDRVVTRGGNLEKLDGLVDGELEVVLYCEHYVSATKVEFTMHLSNLDRNLYPCVVDIF